MRRRIRRWRKRLRPLTSTPLFPLLSVFTAGAIGYRWTENWDWGDCFWGVLVTLTTVGYGDVSPVTAVGKIIGALTAMMGVCTVALLTGIVGAGFSKQMSKQYAEFEHKVREALEDGIISSEEAEEIEALRERMGLSKAQAEELANHLIETKRLNAE